MASTQKQTFSAERKATAHLLSHVFLKNDRRNKCESPIVVWPGPPLNCCAQTHQSASGLLGVCWVNVARGVAEFHKPALGLKTKP